MGEQEQRVEFETRIGAKELMDFKIYHNYHSVSGIASLLFGIIALVICIVSINRVNISYTLMMGFFGLFFTVYTPIGMKRKVNKQIKTVPAFAEPVKYVITPEKITLSQGEVSEELLWDDIFTIKCTGKSMILYITSVRANIIPLECLDRQQAENFIKIKKDRLFLHICVHAIISGGQWQIRTMMQRSDLCRMQRLHQIVFFISCIRLHTATMQRCCTEQQVKRQAPDGIWII